MNTDALKLLVFDLGHVIVDFDWDEICAGFAGISNKSDQQLRKAFLHCSKLGYETGKIDTEGFLLELNKALGTTLATDQFTQLWVATFCENLEMAELLSVLKEQRPLYMLSNTNEAHFDYLEEKFNISRHFAELILSYKTGFAKPDPDIYREIVRLSGFKPGECLFIDDLKLNILGAQAAGLKTILFTSVFDLKKQLAELGFRVKAENLSG